MVDLDTRIMMERVVTDPIQQTFINTIIEYSETLCQNGTYCMNTVVLACRDLSFGIRVEWFENRSCSHIPTFSVLFNAIKHPDYLEDAKRLPWDKMISLQVNDILPRRLNDIMSRCLMWKPAMYEGKSPVVLGGSKVREELLADFTRWHLWTFARVLGDVNAQVGRMLCGLSWLT